MTSKGQHSGFSYEHPSQGYSRKPPVTATEANCGFIHEGTKSDPPVNVATGAVEGNEIAVPTLSAVSAKVGKDPKFVEPEVELGLEDLELGFGLVVLPAAHPTKFGMVTLTPAHS